MRGRFGALLVVLGLAAAGCGGGSEAKVIEQYLKALRAKDNMTLASFSAARFEQPVQSWSIKGTVEENKEPMPLPDLLRKMNESKAALDQNTKEYKAYYQAHPNEVEQVRNLSHDAKPGGRLQSTFSDWQKFTQREKELKKTLSETREAVEREKRTMALSLSSVPADVESLQGDVETKKVEVDLTINGQSQPYLITVRKYNVKRETGPPVSSRWMIQNVTPKA
jgi:hypothetical protein